MLNSVIQVSTRRAQTPSRDKSKVAMI